MNEDTELLSRVTLVTTGGMSGDMFRPRRWLLYEYGRKHLLCSDHSTTRSTTIYSVYVSLTFNRTLLARPWRFPIGRAASRIILKITWADSIAASRRYYRWLAARNGFTYYLKIFFNQIRLWDICNFFCLSSVSVGGLQSLVEIHMHPSKCSSVTF
jgi:hypothetical protein